MMNRKKEKLVDELKHRGKQRSGIEETHITYTVYKQGLPWHKLRTVQDFLIQRAPSVFFFNNYPAPNTINYLHTNLFTRE